MKNLLSPHTTDWTRPIIDSIDVTPSNDLIVDHDGDPVVFRGIYVGTGGDVTVVTYGRHVQEYKNLVAGVWHPIAGRKITAATASDIIVGW